MKDKKKVEILLRIIERVYTKSPGMQKLLDESMTCMQRRRCVTCAGIFCFWC